MEERTITLENADFRNVLHIIEGRFQKETSPCLANLIRLLALSEAATH